MSDIEVRFLDKRTMERYVRMGLVDEKVLEKHLKSLPDLADKAVRVEATLTGAEDDEAEGEGED